MKKVTEIIKPLLSIIFGALLLLLYMSYLRDGIPAFTLVIAIFGVVFAAYYIAAGILNVVMGDKLSKTIRMIFDILNVCLFALVFFLQLISTIVYMSDMMSATAWVITIVSMIAALGLMVFVIVSKAASSPLMERLAYLFAGIFTLALLLDVIFDASGAPEAIGNLAMVILAIYGIYISMMFAAVAKPAQGNQPKQAEEKPQEEQPAEEAQEQQNQVDDKSYEEFLAYQQEDKKE